MSEFENLPETQRDFWKRALAGMEASAMYYVALGLEKDDFLDAASRCFDFAEHQCAEDAQ